MARWRRGNGKHGENKRKEEPRIGRSGQWKEPSGREAPSKTGQALARPSFLACKTRNQLSAGPAVTNYMRLSNSTRYVFGNMSSKEESLDGDSENG